MSEREAPEKSTPRKSRQRDRDVHVVPPTMRMLIPVLRVERAAAGVNVEIIQVLAVSAGFDAEVTPLFNGDVEGAAHVEPVEVGQAVRTVVRLVRTKTFEVAGGQRHQCQDKKSGKNGCEFHGCHSDLWMHLLLYAAMTRVGRFTPMRF
jgi:hypothetical protein